MLRFDKSKEAIDDEELTYTLEAINKKIGKQQWSRVEYDFAQDNKGKPL